MQHKSRKRQVNKEALGVAGTAGESATRSHASNMVLDPKYSVQFQPSLIFSNMYTRGRSNRFLLEDSDVYPRDSATRQELLSPFSE